MLVNMKIKKYKFTVEVKLKEMRNNYRHRTGMTCIAHMMQ